MNRHASTLALTPALLLVAACSHVPATGDATRAAGARNPPAAPAYRIRAERDAPLDADAGWAGGLSEPATVTADQPFRMRLELAPPADLRADCLRLQYRRNEGPWIPLEAHDFPYPLRELEITFPADAAGAVPAGWKVAAGSASALEVADDADGAVLRATATDAALIAMYPAPWNLAGSFGFAAQLRIAAAGPRAVGLVFGYVGPTHHWRLELDAAGRRIRVLRIEGGTEQLVAEHPADVRAGAWQIAEVQLEDGLLAFNFDDDAVEFSLPAPADLPAAVFGFHLPAGGRADFRGFVIEGEPSSPRASIVATGGYANGAPAGDLLAGIAAPPAPGVGVNLAECAPVALSAGQHAEFEWPLVIRRFADAAVTNEPGDVFAFRVADAAGRPVAGAPTPALTLAVPAGHLGGTFVETPGRIGPWQARNGDLYFVMEPAESDNLFMVVKSTDGGRSWREVDGTRRPATGDLESVDGRLVGDTLHLLHQVSETVYYHAFRTSDHPAAPDSWAVTDEPAAAATARVQMASLVVRPDRSLVAFHLGETVGYSIRTPGGAWGEPKLIDDARSDAPLTAGPQAVLGADGVVHLAYTRQDGTIWYRRLLPNDTLTAAQQLAAGAGTDERDLGTVLPLVYLPQSDTVVVVYRLADGRLHERRIRGAVAPSPAAVVADRRVVQDAVDSQQAGADVVGWRDGLVVMLIDETDRSLYSLVDRGAGWEPPTLQVDGIVGSWVRGNVYRRADGATVYGYVYDAGSRGGAGMNRYGELVLEGP